MIRAPQSGRGIPNKPLRSASHVHRTQHELSVSDLRIRWTGVSAFVKASAKHPKSFRSLKLAIHVHDWGNCRVWSEDWLHLFPVRLQPFNVTCEPRIKEVLTIVSTRCTDGTVPVLGLTDSPPCSCIWRLYFVNAWHVARLASFPSDCLFALGSRLS